MTKFIRSQPRKFWVNFYFLLIMLTLVAFAPSGKAHDDENEDHDPKKGKWAKCSWDAPTYGTPVDHYVLQVEERGFQDVRTVTHAPIDSLQHHVWVFFGNTYKARVAGVDSLDRQGPWSLWTDFYGPEKPHE